MAGMTKAQLTESYNRLARSSAERIAQLERELAEASAERAEALSKLVVWETVTQPEGERLGAQMAAELETLRGAQAKLDELGTTLADRDAAIDELTDELVDVRRDRDAAEAERNAARDDAAIWEHRTMIYSTAEGAAVDRLRALQAQIEAERRVGTETVAKLLKRVEDSEHQASQMLAVAQNGSRDQRAREGALFDLFSHLVTR